MNELVVSDRAAQWHRLKALVLDSVSSPITRRVYNLGLDEFIAWFQQEPRPAGFRKATVTAWRVALEARKLGPISINRPDHGGAEAGGRGDRQRTTRAGVGVGDRADQGRQNGRRACWKLAVAPPGSGAPERSGRTDEEGPPRPGHVRHTARLRTAPVRTG